MNPAIHTYNYKVDFLEVEHFIEIHEVLKRDLEFPDYYGGNLHALRDCLTDMLGGINYIVIYGFDNILSRHPDYSQKNTLDIQKHQACLRRQIL